MNSLRISLNEFNVEQNILTLVSYAIYIWYITVFFNAYRKIVYRKNMDHRHKRVSCS